MSKPKAPKCGPWNDSYPLAQPDSLSSIEQRTAYWHASYNAVTRWKKVLCIRCGRKVLCLVNEYDGHMLWCRMPPHRIKSEFFQRQTKKRFDQRKRKERR